ncbi:molybdopterin-dependent oxidoreductase [Escherichia coli]|nr:molybdopterin-dependent oxidoreductase [Escherichia coli]EFU2197620.1 molybdopterin-dependent oxidoreductase [Escherichia coli]EFU2221107.1 molybdopterin-dependent oxidoreductase [Escherichia coli]GDO46017.1 biotin sulfoxide reductase [Escherichia coli]
MANSSSRYSVLTAAHWGPMLVETDGETVFSSRGALATGMENSLQSAVRDQVHSNTRVRFPMVRKGFLASPENPQGIRGQDEFVRVSWDEALDLIHQQHKFVVSLLKNDSAVAFFVARDLRLRRRLDFRNLYKTGVVRDISAFISSLGGYKSR